MYFFKIYKKVKYLFFRAKTFSSWMLSMSSFVWWPHFLLWPILGSTSNPISENTTRTLFTSAQFYTLSRLQNSQFFPFFIQYICRKMVFSFNVKVQLNCLWHAASKFAFLKDHSVNQFVTTYNFLTNKWNILSKFYLVVCKRLIEHLNLKWKLS